MSGILHVRICGGSGRQLLLLPGTRQRALDFLAGLEEFEKLIYKLEVKCPSSFAGEALEPRSEQAS